MVISSLLIHNVLLRPGPTAVGTPLDQQVDVAVIAAIVLSTFAERQQTALPGDDQGRNPVGVVAVFPTHKQVRLAEAGWRQLRFRRRPAPDAEKHDRHGSLDQAVDGFASNHDASLVSVPF